MPALRKMCVTICACTYRRPVGLATLLEGLGKQTFARLTPPSLSIVIADNEGSDRAREVCDQFRRSSDIPIEYVHEVRRGISHARNACLAQLRDSCDFFAMIDDDEIPDPDWIEQLLLAQQRTGADVVEGRVVPVFPKGAPSWIVRGGYFGWHHDLDDAQAPGQQVYPELEEARTNNVLVRSDVVRTLDLRFDHRFALSGGGDIVFFRAIRAGGYRIVYARDACVREMIPQERASLRYLWRRWYRVGANARFKQPIAHKRNGSLPRILKRKLRSSGCSEISTGLAIIAGKLLRGRAAVGHIAPGIKRFAHGLGQAASAIGIKYEQYREYAGGESLHSHLGQHADR
jgi:succinoglycan biosynthesis protein ExoM